MREEVSMARRAYRIVAIEADWAILERPSRLSVAAGARQNADDVAPMSDPIRSQSR